MGASEKWSEGGGGKELWNKKWRRGEEGKETLASKGRYFEKPRSPTEKSVLLIGAAYSVMIDV